jgi:uncharacterized membrane protein
MNWMLLVLLSLLITSGNSVLDKQLMKGRSAPPFLCTLSFGIVRLPVALVGVWFLPPMPVMEALMGLIAGSVFVGAAWLYYDIVIHEDISRVVPLLRLTSVLTLLLAALFLGEALSTKELQAFGFMVFGGVFLSLKSDERGGLVLSRSCVRMLPVTGLLAINNILNAHVYRATSVWQGIVWESLGIVITLVCAGAVMRWQRWSIGQVNGWGMWGILIGEQMTRMLATVTSAYAVANGMSVSLISALSGMQLFVVWLLAVLLLREPITRTEVVLKGIGIMSMTLGILFLWLM